MTRQNVGEASSAYVGQIVGKCDDDTGRREDIGTREVIERRIDIGRRRDILEAEDGHEDFCIRTDVWNFEKGKEVRYRMYTTTAVCARQRSDSEEKSFGSYCRPAVTVDIPYERDINLLSSAFSHSSAKS